MPPMAAGLNGFTVGLTDLRWAEQQTSMLGEMGARVIVACEAAAAQQLIELICDGGVDAVTFTTGQAVRNFMAFADRSRRGRNVLAALNEHTLVACAGPEPASVAAEEGIARAVQPPSSRVGSLVRLVHDELLDRRRLYLVAGSDMVLQGAIVLVDGQPVELDEREKALLSKLAERPGTIVRRRVLMRHVWKDPGLDPGVLESTVDSLRAKLGPVGAALESSMRRGYRLRAVEGILRTG